MKSWLRDMNSVTLNEEQQEDAHIKSKKYM
jgi:hypothetical protein